MVLGERLTGTWVLEGTKGAGKEQPQRTVLGFMLFVHSFAEEESSTFDLLVSLEWQQYSHKAGPPTTLWAASMA